MKTKHLLFLLLLLMTFSCKKFLKEDLQGQYSSASFYITSGNAQKAVTGAYNILLFNSPDNALWVFGDVASDDAEKGGAVGDQLDIQYIDQFNVVSSNSELLSIWTRYYEGISRSNFVLYYVPDIAMDNALKARLLGEAKFIRAFMYFNLVNIFGDIPLKLNPPITQGDIMVAKSNVEVIYAQIYKDLNEAARVLPAKYSAGDIGRVTKGAALGLLAKAYLYQANYNSVVTTIATIDSLGLYSLMPIYRNNFEASTQSNAESLFEIHHLRGQDPSLGNDLNQWFGPKGEGIYSTGYGFDAPLPGFVNEFEKTADSVVDPRLDYSIGRAGKPWVNGEPFDPTWSTTGFLNRKHIQPFSEVSTANADGYLSYVYLRYADILLIKAEALNELGRSAEALVPLNLVRKRARESYLFDTKIEGYNNTVPLNLLPDIISTDQATVRTAIQHERRVELGLEFHRFFDLMRYGKTVAGKALSNTNFSFDKDRYFPIPLNEQDNNTAL